MSVKRRWILGVVVAVGMSVATVASAHQARWLTELDALERAEEDHGELAEALRGRAERLDEHLATTMLDSDTAQRATGAIRAEVVANQARWDRAHRRSQRVEWTRGPGEARAVQHALRHSHGEKVQEIQGHLELLGDVRRGVDEADHLLVVRGELSVEHALWRARQAGAAQSRGLVIELAGDGTQAQAIADETEELAEELAEELERVEGHVTGRDFHRRRGGLVPPVAAAPDHPFGPRKQEGSMTYVRHTGLTYFVDAGTEVRSVGEGLVVIAGRMPGFGKVVIVDHDGYHSLYAHLKEFSVEAGDAVGDRQVVGLSGETGSLEGPKLYFELRRQGQPIDPAEWFIRR